MVPSFSRPLLPPLPPASWTTRNINSSGLSDPSSPFISMTDLLSAGRLPCLGPMDVLHVVDERYDARRTRKTRDASGAVTHTVCVCVCSLNGRRSEWTDLLRDAESLEYVSPDVDACITAHRAFEVDDELDLTGNEFLQSPPILANLDALEEAMAEKIVPDSPVMLTRLKPSTPRRECSRDVCLLRRLCVASLTIECAIEQELAERDYETSQTPSVLSLETLLNLALTAFPDYKRSGNRPRRAQARCSSTASTTLFKTASETTLPAIACDAARIGQSELPAAASREL